MIMLVCWQAETNTLVNGDAISIQLPQFIWIVSHQFDGCYSNAFSIAAGGPNTRSSVSNLVGGLHRLCLIQHPAKHMP